MLTVECLEFLISVVEMNTTSNENESYTYLLYFICLTNNMDLSPQK